MEGMGHMLREVWDCMNTDLVRSDMDIPEQLFVPGGLASNDNTFVKDCEDPNPLIRALAVRTMDCIMVDKITEYLYEPLGKYLKDEDSYVRKTTAVSVAKLHDINAGNALYFYLILFLPTLIGIP